MTPGLWIDTKVVPPRDPGWLSSAERARLAGMRFPRRRHDFRCGRWIAKRALARAFGAPDAAHALSQLEVLPDSRGAPVAYRQGARLPCDLSLSHRAGAVLCAVGPPTSQLGCDIEWLEPRSHAFVRHFLTANEQRWLEHLPLQAQDEATNLIWSAKESAVKALGCGLDRDVRELRLHLSPASDQVLLIHVPGIDAPLHGRWGRLERWIWTVVSAKPVFGEPARMVNQGAAALTTTA